MYFSNEDLNSLEKEQLIEIIKSSNTIRDSEEESLSKRKRNKVIISCAKDIYKILKKTKIDDYRENFFLISLTSGLKVIKKKLLFLGDEKTVDEISFSIIFKELFSSKTPCCKMIVAHNHPSGDYDPSSADISFTKGLKKWGEALGVELLDHIVFSKEGYTSMQEAGNLSGFPREE